MRESGRRTGRGGSGCGRRGRRRSRGIISVHLFHKLTVASRAGEFFSARNGNNGSFASVTIVFGSGC